MKPREGAAKRFARLPLGARFHIAEQMGTQMQPGSSPEDVAVRTIATIPDGAEFRRFMELIKEAEG